MIKGIDGQIMINRQTDFAKDSAVLIKRGEMAQSEFSSTFREQVQERQVQIQNPNKSERDTAVSRDGHNSAGQEGGRRKRRGTPEEEAAYGEPLPEVGQPLDAIGRRLDITV